MIRVKFLTTMLFFVAAVVLFLGQSAQDEALGENLQDVLATEQAAAQDGAASQARINKIADETETLLYAYRAQARQLESLQAYNAQLQKLIAAQAAEADSLRAQIDGVVHIDRQLTPLMFRMIDALAQFVALDVPFLLDERRARVAALRALMGRADVDVAEKYRKILEAYEIENEYGRTLEVYEGELTLDARARQVLFLRIGRVALIYQTPDGDETGLWVQAQKAFIAWTGDTTALRQAFRVARNQAAPDFLVVPLSVAPHLHQEETP